MTLPRKAVVLAAGFASRMRPLSQRLPKCLLPLWGVTLIDHALDLLAEWGVRDALVNLHHAPAPIVAHLRRRLDRAPRLAFSFEPAILGTGGALRRAAWFAADEPCWMINSDIAADLDPAPLLRLARRRDPVAVLWLTDSAGPRTVRMRDDRIESLRTETPGSAGTYTFCGLQWLAPAIRRYLPDRPFSTIVNAYEAAMADNRLVAGVTVRDSFWMDLGTPEDYLTAHARTRQARRDGQPGARLVCPAALARAQHLRHRGITVDGFAALAPDVTVARGARLRDVVALAGAHIGPTARIDGAVLAPGVRVSAAVRRMAIAAADGRDADLDAVLRRLRWPPAETVLQPQAPRGSARAFTRLCHGAKRAILIRYGVERGENRRYAGHARFLAAIGVRVPRILLDLPRRRLCVVEDLGDTTLADRIAGRPPPAAIRTYRKVLDALAHWHREGWRRARAGRLSLEPAFGPALYAWEHRLFATHVLARHAELPPTLTASAMRELETNARGLNREPDVLLHRDLQSSNILFPDGTPAFIDFQGMRRGPAAYDVASLLCDPYVDLDGPLQRRLLTHYADRAGLDRAAFETAFRRGAVQRLVQALGAYGRLSALPGMRGFQRHIPPALRQLQRAAEALDNLAHLRELVARLSTLYNPAMKEETS